MILDIYVWGPVESSVSSDTELTCIFSSLSAALLSLISVEIELILLIGSDIAIDGVLCVSHGDLGGTLCLTTSTDGLHAIMVDLNVSSFDLMMLKARKVLIKSMIETFDYFTEF